MHVNHDTHRTDPEFRLLLCLSSSSQGRRYRCHWCLLQISGSSSSMMLGGNRNPSSKEHCILERQSYTVHCCSSQARDAACCLLKACNQYTRYNPQTQAYQQQPQHSEYMPQAASVTACSHSLFLFCAICYAVKPDFPHTWTVPPIGALCRRHKRPVAAWCVQGCHPSKPRQMHTCPPVKVCSRLTAWCCAVCVLYTVL